MFSARAVSVRRVELEEFLEPTMRTRSQMPASARTADWRLVVA